MAAEGGFVTEIFLQELEEGLAKDTLAGHAALKPTIFTTVYRYDKRLEHSTPIKRILGQAVLELYRDYLGYEIVFDNRDFLLKAVTVEGW